LAGDVMTTATAGAEGAARIGESVDSAQLGGQDRGETDQATATRPQAGAPDNLHLPPRETPQASPPGATPRTSATPERIARPARPTRQGLAPAAQPASPGAGVRRRLARLGAQRGSGVNPVLEPLVKTIRAHHPKADVRTVERAYGVAAHWHKDQKRKSGDPYITHPLAVATILAELGMDTADAVRGPAARHRRGHRLHPRRAARDFGEEVALLVDGVTKLDKVKYGEAGQAETVRKMVVAMARDPACW
jgi:guanosine-3',5'-bis(diphosphate) 3'-pyrophosphohydrolase